MMTELLNVLKYHHIGIAVKSMEKAIDFYGKLGWHCSDPVYDPLQNVYLSSCRLDNDCMELIAPYDETSPCNTFLKKLWTKISLSMERISSSSIILLID